jgi:hypothetical protein
MQRRLAGAVESLQPGRWGFVISQQGQTAVLEATGPHAAAEPGGRVGTGDAGPVFRRSIAAVRRLFPAPRYQKPAYGYRVNTASRIERRRQACRVSLSESREVMPAIAATSAGEPAGSAPFAAASTANVSNRDPACHVSPVFYSFVGCRIILDTMKKTFTSASVATAPFDVFHVATSRSSIEPSPIVASSWFT